LEREHVPYDDEALDGRDPCVVKTAPLARIVREYEQLWRRQRPRRAELRTSYDPEAISALSAKTSVPTSTISNILQEKNVTTELRIADALVTSLHKMMVFRNGTLEVFPNPRRRDSDRLCKGCRGRRS
jgi:hypothetical protein